MAPIIFENVLDEAKNVFNSIDSQGCLDKGLMLCYIHGELDEATSIQIRAHLVHCEHCQVFKLTLEAEEVEFSMALTSDPDQILSTLAGQDGAQHINLIIKDNNGAISPTDFVSKIKESMIEWISPIWEPVMAGQVITAADLQQQSKQFDMDYGEYIHISCFWEGKTPLSEPYVKLTWQANLITADSLWVRFINPESQEIYTEILLGNELEGEVNIEQAELGFEPSGDKWAISMVVEKPE